MRQLAEGEGEQETAFDWARPGLWAAVVAYLALTAWLSLELNVWRDEMYSLHTSAASPIRAAQDAIEFELQPPVYFAVLAVWRTMNDSIFFARLLSSLFGAGAIVLFAMLTKRLAPRVDSTFPAVLAATHPFLVWAGTEVRVYALVVLLSAALTLAFLRAYGSRDSDGTFRARLAFAGLALVSLYTQYYLGVLLACFGVALLVRGNAVKVRAYILDLAPVFVLAIPLALAIRAQLQTHASDLAQRFAFGAETLRLVGTRLESYLFTFNRAIDEGTWSLSTIRSARWAYRLAMAVVVLAGALHLRKFARTEPNGARNRFATAKPLVVIVASYAICMGVLFVGMGPMSVGDRHTAGLLVPLLLAAVVLPAALLGRGAAQVWASVLVVSNVAATALTQVAPMAKDCDCRHVAEAITGRETNREPILVFPSEDVMPLSVYYRGQNTLLPVPRPPSYANWDQRLFMIQSTDDVSDVLARGAADPTGLWVHTNKYGKRWGREYLEAFLAEHYREDQRQDFAHGVVLRHFAPRSATSTLDSGH